MREKRDLYDKNGNLTGRTYFKGDKIPDGFYPMVVMIYLQNSKGEFLMQKRSPAKGGDWGVTGGHPKSGETPFEGIITEVKEELGLDITGQPIELVKEGCDGWDCYKIYYLKTDIDTKKLVLQQEEVTGVRWFSMQELCDMAEKHILRKNQIECFLKCKEYLEKKDNG